MRVRLTVLRREARIARRGALVLSGLVGLASQCFAAELAVDDEPQDIVVTANRIETAASKTPITLTALDAGVLARGGVSDPTHLTHLVPALAIVRGSGLQITIRGVGSTDATEKGDASAAFLMDGIAIARPQAQDVSLFDLDRIEVLRGPQGTLFGRNTTAGVIQVLSRKPQLGAVSASIDADAGTHARRRIVGAVNIPVTPFLAVRGAVNLDRRDSFLTAGEKWRPDLGPFRKNLSGRLSTLVDLGEGQLTVIGDYAAIRGKTVDTTPLANWYAGTGTFGVDPVYLGRDRSRADRIAVTAPFNGPIARRNASWGVTGGLQYGLGPITLNYLGSFRRFTRDEDMANTSANGGFAVPGTFTGAYRQTSHEARLSNADKNPFHFQTGVYYFRERSAIAYTAFGVYSPFPDTLGYIAGYRQGPTTSRSWAVFAQASQRLTDAVRITAGARHTRDRKSRTGATIKCATLLCDRMGDIAIPNVAARRWSKTTWRIGLDYRAGAKSFFYGAIASGYKAGGFNDGCERGLGPTCIFPARALYYNPETVTSYEAGLKWATPDGAVRLNGAAFHYAYRGMQLNQFSDICGLPCQVTTNAGRAKIDGLEIDAAASLARKTRIQGGLVWTRARYTRFHPFPGVNWAGKALDRSPRFAATLALTQSAKLPRGATIEAQASLRYASRYALASLASAYQLVIPGGTRSTIGVTVRPRTDWFVQAYAENLENRVYPTAAVFGAFAAIQSSDPRIIGLRSGLRF